MNKKLKSKNIHYEYHTHNLCVITMDTHDERNSNMLPSDYDALIDEACKSLEQDPSEENMARWVKRCACVKRIDTAMSMKELVKMKEIEQRE